MVFQEKLTLAHKTLADDSNARVRARVEEIKSQKLQEQEKKKEAAAQKQLATLNAIKILQKKKLLKLKKKLGQNVSPETATKLAALTSSTSSTSTSSSPLLRLSETEKTQLLQWLDLQRNSDILQKTDRKMAEKLKTKKTSQSAAKTAAQTLLSDLGGIDTDALTDEEIDDLLVALSEKGLAGGSGGGGRHRKKKWFD